MTTSHDHDSTHSGAHPAAHLGAQPDGMRKAHHRNVQGGAARAAVFGASDGLLTNVSLILGIAASNVSASTVRTAGMAGLVAGAVSMAAGEYVSVSAQKELLERELEIERREHRKNPEIEIAELAEIYEARGVPAEPARIVAEALMKDPELALEVHAREEMGIDSRSLGSPVEAALWSLVSFAVGAFLPLFPWLVGQGTAAKWWSIGLGGLGIGAIGFALAGFTGRSRFRSTSRQLLIGFVAAGFTYFVGHLMGASSS